MKLSVSELQKAIESGIERAKERQVEWDQLVDAAEVEWEERWRTASLPVWEQFTARLMTIVSEAGHITEDMIPAYIPKDGRRSEFMFYRRFNRGTWDKGWNKTWSADHDYGPRPIVDVKGFETLRDFLSTVADDHVTGTALERVGFRNLNKLFTAASNGYWDD